MKTHYYVSFFILLIISLLFGYSFLYLKNNNVKENNAIEDLVYSDESTSTSDLSGDADDYTNTEDSEESLDFLDEEIISEQTLPDTGSDFKIDYGADYSILGDLVYFGSDLIDNADLETFQIVETDNLFFAKDKGHVYYEGRIIPGFDPANLSIDGFTVSDVSNLELDNNFPNYYFLGDSTIYYNNRKSHGTVSFDVDINNFKVFNGHYITDGKSIFYYGFRLKDVDIASFEALPEWKFSRDKNSLYFEAYKFSDVDVNDHRLQLVEGCDSYLVYGSDSIYFDGLLVEGISPDNVEVLEGGSILKDGDVTLYLVHEYTSLDYIDSKNEFLAQFGGVDNYVSPCTRGY